MMMAMVFEMVDGRPFVPIHSGLTPMAMASGMRDDDDDADGIADDEVSLDPRFAVGDLDGDGRGDARRPR